MTTLPLFAPNTASPETCAGCHYPRNEHVPSGTGQILCPPVPPITRPAPGSRTSGHARSVALSVVLAFTSLAGMLVFAITGNAASVCTSHTGMFAQAFSTRIAKRCEIVTSVHSLSLIGFVVVGLAAAATFAMSRKNEK